MYTDVVEVHELTTRVKLHILVQKSTLVLVKYQIKYSKPVLRSDDSSRLQSAGDSVAPRLPPSVK